MVRRTITGIFLFWLLSLVMVWTAGTHAWAGVPELKPIPQVLPKEVRAYLVKQEAELTGELNALAARNDELRRNCAEVDEGSPAAEKCSREQAALETGRERYIKAADRFNNIVDAEVAIHELKARIARDQEAIRRLGLKSRAEDFEEWEKLSDEARSQFEEQALASMADLLFGAASDANKAVIGTAGALNTFSSRKLISRLRAKGISNERLFRCIREIGAAKGKPARAKAAKDLIEVVEKEGDLFNIAQEINGNPGDVRTAAEAATALLSWGLEGPLAGVFASDVQFMYASLYNNAARRVSADSIERLTTMTEQQLRDLNDLTRVLKRHVKELQAAREKLAKLRKGDAM